MGEIESVEKSVNIFQYTRCNLSEDFKILGICLSTIYRNRVTSKNLVIAQLFKNISSCYRFRSIIMPLLQNSHVDLRKL
jgi:hypothetical protein